MVAQLCQQDLGNVDYDRLRTNVCRDQRFMVSLDCRIDGGLLS